MHKKLRKAPKYGHHKAKNLARVVIAGRHIYLGEYGSPESYDKYNRVVADWLTGRFEAPEVSTSLTMAELLVLYLRHAEEYYQKGGKVTREYGAIREALSHVRQLFESVEVRSFGPQSLIRVRNSMVAYGWARKHVNKQVGRVTRMFKWGVSQEYVDGETLLALQSVPGLKKGRTDARETEDVKPVDDETIELTLSELGPVVADMVRFQRLTGCRTSETCLLRPADLDRSADVWLYHPESHKNEHLGRDRTITVGPQAQQVILKYLLRADGSYCFDPREAPGARSNSRERYTKDSYSRAVRRAVQRLNRRRGVPWSPGQLRHTRATEIRGAFGLEAAQTVLGHAAADITQIYAERDLRLATEVARKSG